MGYEAIGVLKLSAFSVFAGAEGSTNGGMQKTSSLWPSRQLILKY